MEEIVHILILLVIMNFYLKFRMGDKLQAAGRFLISLLSIIVLFILSWIIVYIFRDRLDQHKQNKLMSPVFINAVFVFMNFIMPVITTEIILAGYKRYKGEGRGTRGEERGT